MRLVIEAPGIGSRGGRAVLDAYIAKMWDAGAEQITVYTLVDDPLIPGVAQVRCIANTYAARIAWATFGWSETSQRYSQSISFTGFARPPRDPDPERHQILIHNALYYEPARRLFSKPAQMRLALLRELTHLSAQSAGTVWVQTPHMVDHVKAHHGVRARLLNVIPRLPPPVDGPVLAPAAHRVLWVGNDAPHKRFDRLLEWAEAHPESACSAVGLEGAHPKIRFYPNLSRAEIHRAMIEADLLLMTSEAESLGLPLYEAMEVGLSVIAPDLPYVRAAGVLPKNSATKPATSCGASS